MLPVFKCISSAHLAYRDKHHQPNISILLQIGQFQSNRIYFMCSPTLVAFFNGLGGGLTLNVIPHFPLRAILKFVRLAPMVGKGF
jgi:hypothetical protein